MALPLQRDRPTLVLTGSDEVIATAKGIPIDVDVLWLTDASLGPPPRLGRSQVWGLKRTESWRGLARLATSGVSVQVFVSIQVFEPESGDPVAVLPLGGATVLVLLPMGGVVVALDPVDGSVRWVCPADPTTSVIELLP